MARAASAPERAEIPDKLTLRLWLRLLACSTLVEKTIRARLAREFATTLPRFDVLAALERAPAGLQLGELSKSLRVSNGNITGIIARLVAEGMVDRQADESDARVARVSLTPSGREAFLRMSGAHQAWVEALFGGIDGEEQAELLALLSRLRRALANNVGSGFGPRPL